MIEKMNLHKGEIKKETLRLGGAIFGTVLYALGINLFVVPSNLYTGGVMGICQVIRTILVEYAHINFGNMDIAGIIYYVINIPIFIIAMKRIGKRFFVKTLICVTTVTIFLTIIPIPKTPILGADVLASALIGGLVSGVGVGVTLIFGSSDGGMDVVGVLLVRWKKNFSVGRVNLAVNAILYAGCLFLFDVPTVIYSLIYAALYSVAIDRVHAQNIDVEVKIITKKNTSELQQNIFTELGRGITKWQAMGAYTEENTEVLYVLMSKYEVSQVRHMVNAFDPDAFIIVNEGVSVEGNYLKKL